jgi:hypothetical protein
MNWSTVKLHRPAFVCTVVSAAALMSGCGAADESQIATSGAEDDAVGIASSESALRGRRSRRRNPPPVDPGTGDNGGTSGGTDSSGTGGGPVGGTRDTGPFNNGQCTNNGPVAGGCNSYGDQCVYATSTAVHFCTYLVSTPSTPGTQGWSCR